MSNTFIPAGGSPASGTADAALPPLFGPASVAPRDCSDQAKPLPGLYRWVGFGLVTYCISDALLTIHSLVVLWLFSVARSGELAGESLNSISRLIDMTGSVVGIGGVVVYLVCVVLVSRFVYRAMNNLWLARSPAVTISPAWAVGWYFIPFALWVKPLQAMNEIWRGSNDKRPGDNTPGTMGLWWGCWVITNLAGNVSIRLSMDAGTFSAGGIHDIGLYSNSLWIDIVSTPLSIIAALALLSIAGSITRGQEKLRAASTF